MLRLIHDQTYRGANNRTEPIKRFRILKSGVFSSVTVQAESNAGGWKFAGTLDILTFADSTRRSSAIAKTSSIPLNKEPLLIPLNGIEVRYFAFDPYKGRRAFLNEVRLKIWGADFEPITDPGVDIDGDGVNDIAVDDGRIIIPL